MIPASVLITASNQPIDTGTESGNMIAVWIYYGSLIGVAVLGGLLLKNIISEAAKSGSGKAKTDEMIGHTKAHIFAVIVCGGINVLTTMFTGFLPGFAG